MATNHAYNPLPSREGAIVSLLKSESALVALPALAHHLAGERDAILRDWRSRVEAETESSVLTRLSHAECCDDIPQFLDRLCSVLRGNTKATTGRFARYHGRSEERRVGKGSRCVR